MNATRLAPPRSADATQKARDDRPPITDTPPPPARTGWDWTGGAISGVCGLHCAASSAWVLLNPGIWLSAGRAGWGVWMWRLELLLALAAVLVGFVAMVLGYLRHRRLLPGVVSLAGICAISYGVLSGVHRFAFWGSAIVLGGGLLLITAHILNARLRSRARSPG